MSKTMIGAARLSPDFAHAKASACVGLHCSSRELRDKYVNDDGIGPRCHRLLRWELRLPRLARRSRLSREVSSAVTRWARDLRHWSFRAASDEDEHCAP